MGSLYVPLYTYCKSPYITKMWSTPYKIGNQQTMAFLVHMKNIIRFWTDDIKKNLFSYWWVISLIPISETPSVKIKSRIKYFSLLLYQPPWIRMIWIKTVKSLISVSRIFIDLNVCQNQDTRCIFFQSTLTCMTTYRPKRNK